MQLLLKISPGNDSNNACFRECACIKCSGVSSFRFHYPSLLSLLQRECRVPNDYPHILRQMTRPRHRKAHRSQPINIHHPKNSNGLTRFSLVWTGSLGQERRGTSWRVGGRCSMARTAVPDPQRSGTHKVDGRQTVVFSLPVPTHGSLDICPSLTPATSISFGRQEEERFLSIWPPINLRPGV
ncbi:hypothetical protein CEXT_413031 [Caerostris extrusa]|uniref:Uncharacterized protein n=1 Tax=Caerostris extrusa TaxID=172846 RepID=A0AAV4N6S8_CAEEX|nr:hypothetical protein CEXT_413031 [Caerostris extrusa]